MNDSTNQPRRGWLKGLAGAAMLPLASPMAATNPRPTGDYSPLPNDALHAAGRTAVGTSPWPRRLTPTEVAGLAAVSW
jgi:hypothetical protein